VYSRAWDSWTEKDPFGEQIAGVLLSVALIKPPAEKPSRSMTSVHVPEGTAAGVNLSMLMFAMRPDILAILELDGRIVCCNPLLTAILGIDGNDQTGKEISGLLPADDAARVRRNIAGTLKSELDSHALCVTIVVVGHQGNYPKKEELMEDDNGLPKKSQRDSNPNDVAAGEQVNKSDRADAWHSGSNAQKMATGTAG